MIEQCVDRHIINAEARSWLYPKYKKLTLLRDLELIGVYRFPRVQSNLVRVMYCHRITA